MFFSISVSTLFRNSQKQLGPANLVPKIALLQAPKTLAVPSQYGSASPLRFQHRERLFMPMYVGIPLKPYTLNYPSRAYGIITLQVSINAFQYQFNSPLLSILCRLRQSLISRLLNEKSTATETSNFHPFLRYSTKLALFSMSNFSNLIELFKIFPFSFFRNSYLSCAISISFILHTTLPQLR